MNQELAQAFYFILGLIVGVISLNVIKIIFKKVRK